MNKQRRAALAKALPLVEQAQAILAEAMAIVESVRDDEREVFDNLSEGAQAGDQGDAMQTAMGQMDEAADGIAGLDLKAIADAISEACDQGSDVAVAALGPAEAEARREARLPAWAKARIAAAEKAARDADERLSSSFGEPDEEDRGQIVIDDFLSPLRGKVLPSRQVSFPGLGIRVSYDDRRRALAVSAVSIGSLAIHPEASNTVRIAVDRF